MVGFIVSLIVAKISVDPFDSISERRNLFWRPLCWSAWASAFTSTVAGAAGGGQKTEEARI